MTNQCAGLAGLLMGHKFRPVYELGAPTITAFEASRISLVQATDFIRASRPQRYIHTECARCGMTIQDRAEVAP